VGLLLNKLSNQRSLGPKCGGKSGWAEHLWIQVAEKFNAPKDSRGTSTLGWTSGHLGLCPFSLGGDIVAAVWPYIRHFHSIRHFLENKLLMLLRPVALTNPHSFPNPFLKMPSMNSKQREIWLPGT